jgi:hypothetical protein
LKPSPPELESRGNPRQARADNDTRATAIDEMVRLGGGDKPWKVNPGRGGGMKQAHQAAEGVSRRGREKRRGRTVGRGWNLARKWISAVDVAMGNGTPREALDASVRGADSQRFGL